VAGFDPATGTITICSNARNGGPFPEPVTPGTPFRVVRQIPHFSEDGHQGPNYLGQVYYELVIGQR
jgi:hypothetical protein